MSLSIVRLQEDGTECRRQRQGIKCRDKDADSHRHTELTIERSRCSTDERHGDEHRSHHQSNGDDSTGDLIHRIDGSREGALVALIQLGMYGLNYHDGIIDHDGDGQQQCREHQQVDGESEHLQEEERTHQ